MYPGKVRTPFSLYERKFPGRPSVWYVKFWDESSRKYRKARSTGVEAVGKRRRRADAEAFLGQFFGNCQTCLLISGSDVYTEFVRGLLEQHGNQYPPIVTPVLTIHFA